MNFFNRSKKQSTKLDDAELAAAKVHKTNITKIKQTREKAEKLNRVLKENNITLQLARAMGHK